METLIKNLEPVVRKQPLYMNDKNSRFETLWKNSISGDEFVRRTHEHIKKLYALRDNQQTDH